MPHWEYLERLLQSLYLKEIDQEENIWRSLPFFSATLALEVAALAQIVPMANQISGLWQWVVLALGAALAALMLSALIFLFRSIRRQSFAYIASGTDLVGYAQQLEQSVADAAELQDGRVAARLRTTVIAQLAAAADANRKVNQRRAAERTRAGLLLLASIVAIFLIVAVLIGHEVAGATR